MLERFKSSANQQFAVLGLGRFGIEMVKAINSIGCEVLAVDLDEEKTVEVSDYATHTIVADASEESTLKSIAIDSFDVVIIAIGDNMQASIITALNCKEMGVKKIVAKANNEKHAKVLEKIGVDQVVVPERDSAYHTATLLSNPKVNDIMELHSGYCIAEIEMPKIWVGETLVSLKLRNKHKINVLLIASAEGSEAIVPDADTIFRENCRVVIGGLAQNVKHYVASVK